MTTSKTAICQLCEERFDRARVTHHLKYCIRRRVANGPERREFAITNAPSEQHLCHVRISSDFPNNLHYIHLLVRPDVTLRQVDDFLREAWTEPCCPAGHNSIFTKGENRFSSDIPDHENSNLNTTMRHLWQQDGSGPDYVFDPDLFVACNLVGFGTWPVEASEANEPIRLLARNDPPDQRCTTCSKPATKAICHVRKRSLDTMTTVACDDCGNPDANWLPLINSPRAGSCQYGLPQGQDLQRPPQR